MSVLKGFSKGGSCVMGKNRLVVGIVFLCVFFELVIPAHTTHHVVIHQLTSAPGGQGGGECWPENAKSSYRQNQDPRKNRVKT
jgi:hypothetical protein